MISSQNPSYIYPQCLVGDGQVLHILLEVVVQQHGALEGDEAGQVLAGAGIILQDSLAGTHLIILS